LAFLFFAITGLRQKLKKQAQQRPSLAATGDSTDRTSPAANPLSPGAPSNAKHSTFSRDLAQLRKMFQLVTQKIFSSIAQFEESSKKYLEEKRLLPSERAPVPIAIVRLRQLAVFSAPHSLAAQVNARRSHPALGCGNRDLVSSPTTKANASQKFCV